MTGKFPDLFRNCVLWFTGSTAAQTMAAKTITANGAATHNTSEYKFGTAALGLNDVAAWISVADSAFLEPLTYDFAIECWYKITTLANNQPIFAHFADASNLHTITCNRYSVTWKCISGGSTLFSITSTGALVYATFTHVACVRNGSSFVLYIDGNPCGSATYAGALPDIAAVDYLGYDGTPTHVQFGVIDEFRVSIGTPRYRGAFTPQNSAFITDKYTTLLLHFDGTGSTFTDSAAYTSYDEFPIIPSGVTVTNNGTFTKTDLGNNKSVLNFDGSTNYISLADSASWDIWDADFAICFWLRFNSISGTQMVFSQYTDANNRVFIYKESSEQGLWLYGLTGGVNNFIYVSYPAMETGIWYFITIIRSGSTCYMYKNASSINVTVTQQFRNTTAISGELKIGTQNAASLMNGNIKDLLIYKGRALTVPEIKLLMDRTHPITGAGLIPGPYDYWRLS